MLKTNKLLPVLTTMSGGRLQCLLSIIYLVQLHWQVRGLEVEGDELAAAVPEDLRHEVGGVRPRALGVDPAQLPLVVVHELHGLGLQVTQGGGLRERGHLTTQFQQLMVSCRVIVGLLAVAISQLI